MERININKLNELEKDGVIDARSASDLRNLDKQGITVNWADDGSTYEYIDKRGYTYTGKVGKGTKKGLLRGANKAHRNISDAMKHLRSFGGFDPYEEPSTSDSDSDSSRTDKTGKTKGMPYVAKTFNTDVESPNLSLVSKPIISNTEGDAVLPGNTADNRFVVYDESPTDDQEGHRQRQELAKSYKYIVPMDPGSIFGKEGTMYNKGYVAYNELPEEDGVDEKFKELVEKYPDYYNQYKTSNQYIKDLAEGLNPGAGFYRYGQRDIQSREGAPIFDNEFWGKDTQVGTSGRTYDKTRELGDLTWDVEYDDFGENYSSDFNQMMDALGFVGGFRGALNLGKVMPAAGRNLGKGWNLTKKSMKYPKQALKYGWNNTKAWWDDVVRAFKQGNSNAITDQSRLLMEKNAIGSAGDDAFILIQKRGGKSPIFSKGGKLVSKAQHGKLFDPERRAQRKLDKETRRAKEAKYAEIAAKNKADMEGAKWENRVGLLNGNSDYLRAINPGKSDAELALHSNGAKTSNPNPTGISLADLSNRAGAYATIMNNDDAIFSKIGFDTNPQFIDESPTKQLDESGKLTSVEKIKIDGAVKDPDEIGTIVENNQYTPDPYNYVKTPLGDFGYGDIADLGTRMATMKKAEFTQPSLQPHQELPQQVGVTERGITAGTAAAYDRERANLQAVGDRTADVAINRDERLKRAILGNDVGMQKIMADEQARVTQEGINRDTENANLIARGDTQRLNEGLVKEDAYNTARTTNAQAGADAKFLSQIGDAVLSTRQRAGYNADVSRQNARRELDRKYEMEVQTAKMSGMEGDALANHLGTLLKDYQKKRANLVLAEGAEYPYAK